MITKLYKDHLKKLNQKFNNKNIYDFEPNISNDFEKDKVIFSNFWRDCLKENKKELRSIVELTKKIFLKTYSSNIYNQIIAIQALRKMSTRLSHRSVGR